MFWPQDNKLLLFAASSHQRDGFAAGLQSKAKEPAAEGGISDCTITALVLGV